MTPLWARPAHELAGLLRAGEVASRELVDAHLERIAAVDDDLNAVVTLDAGRARAAADAADEARAAGRSLGPLHGLPMTIKDVFRSAGLRTTAGTAALDHVPDADAVALARLREAGAIVLGKTNVPPRGLDLQTDNDLFGRTHNPHDHDRSPGGSSGGAAAALATGMTPLELGSDLAGSLRLPAAWCGVVGHKPTYGIVPTRGHVPPRPGVLGTGDVLVAGPMARTVADLDLALGVLAGPHGGDARGWRLELPAPPREGEEVRIGVWLTDERCPTGSEERAVLDRAADDLARAGAQIREVRPDVDMHAHLDMAFQLMEAGVGGGLPEGVYNRLAATAAAAAGDGEQPLTVRAAAWMTASHRDWLRADERRRHHRRAFEAALADVDVLLTPAVPVAAIPHIPTGGFFDRTIEIDGDVRPYADLATWAVAVGALHLPATAVPVGVTADGLPVGAQLVGARHADRTCLAAARLVERVCGGSVLSTVD